MADNDFTSHTQGQTEQYSGGALIIKVPRDKLGYFISNLLGRPQRIKKTVRASFDIDIDWIANLYSLIVQRVERQNESTLVEFNAILLFIDGFSREITSIEELRIFTETLNVYSRGFRMTWTFLVRFPNKELPEKQDICMEATSDELETRITKYAHMDKIASSIMRSNTGIISIEINHTERTWGDDVYTLIDNFIKRTTKKPTWVQSILRKYFSLIIIINFLLMFVIVISAEGIKAHRLEGMASEHLLSITNANNNEDVIANTVKFATNYLIASQPHVREIILAFMPVASLIIATLIIEVLHPIPRSFVILNDKTKAFSENWKRKSGRFKILVMTILIGVIPSLVAAYLFEMWRG